MLSNEADEGSRRRSCGAKGDGLVDYERSLVWKTSRQREADSQQPRGEEREESEECEMTFSNRIGMELSVIDDPRF